MEGITDVKNQPLKMKVQSWYAKIVPLINQDTSNACESEADFSLFVPALIRRKISNVEYKKILNSS